MLARAVRLVGVLGVLAVTLGGCAGGATSAFLVGRVDELECSLHDQMMAEQDPGARRTLEDQLKRAVEARRPTTRPVQVEAGGGGGGY